MSTFSASANASVPTYLSVVGSIATSYINCSCCCFVCFHDTLFLIFRRDLIRESKRSFEASAENARARTRSGETSYYETMDARQIDE